jgi:membrane complex biogenesis BtpA family protein
LELPRLIGVVHLPPLGGSPQTRGLTPRQALAFAGEWAVQEVRAMTRAGFEGVIIENLGDAPFYKDRVPAETVASMSVIAAACQEVTSLPIGVNLLRNDGGSALAVAAVTGSAFIRVNVISGVVATDQGLIEGNAAHLVRERARLGVEREVGIFADVLVKHARTLSSDDLEIALEDTALRGGADAVILTGASTGRAADPALLERAHAIATHHGIATYVGSGASLKNLEFLSQTVSGVIVGSALREGGKAGEPLHLRQMKAFVAEFRKHFDRPPSRKAVGRKGRR